jgi:tetratricopeptide (TPR) repeat protein
MRFFISFSSRNKPVVREIMAGLRSQNIDFWDYSDDLWSISMTAIVLETLKEEIDKCDYFVAVVSKESVEPSIGHFTRLEVEYALQVKKMHEQKRVITVELEGICLADYNGPYLPLKDYMHYELIWNEDKGKSIRSFIGLMKRICYSVGIQYMPEISPHHRMPFWERFRDEIQKFDHKNHSHIELMGNLGEFNEFFKLKDYGNALQSIRHFVFSCEYYIPEYTMLYPWIVRGVTEQFLGNHQEALFSYQKALLADKENPDALAGLGQAYRILGDFKSAVDCYERAKLSAPGMKKVNMFLHIVFSKVSGKILPTNEERDFIKGLDVEHTVARDIEELEQRGLLPDISDGTEESLRERERVIAERKAEERNLILTARALTYYAEAEFSGSSFWSFGKKEQLRKAYDIFKYDFPEEAISEGGIVYYYYLIARKLGIPSPESILANAIARAKKNNVKNSIELTKYLAEHYIIKKDYDESIKVYEQELTGQLSDARGLIYYALALYKSGKSENISKCKLICINITSNLPSGYPGFYWSGFANYLLGNTTYARHDYERSNLFGPYYDGLV